jgi:organic radical activating enzyme
LYAGLFVLEIDMKYGLTEDWKNVKELVIYGFGKVAHDNLHFFKDNFHVVCIVDGNIEKCGVEFKGIEVKHISKAKEELRKYKIVIMTANRNAASVGKDLDKLGLQAGKDYCSMEQFLTEWFWHYKKKVCLMEVHSTITSRCTLKCKHCNMFMPYYKEHIDYTAKDILEDLELLFRHVDYIVSYRLLGGEPLINKELADMIEQIGDKYSNRIGNIGIITNGTLLPDGRLIEVSKKYDVKYDFSDYTDVVDYKTRFDESVAKISEAGLRYQVNRSLRWCDFGFPVNNRMYDFDKVREHMLSCGPIFHGLNDGRYYYCHVSWSADKAKLLKNVSDDYVDLRTLNDDDSAKEAILEHSNGNIEKGFVKLCKICGGCGNDNTEFVKAAEQM